MAACLTQGGSIVLAINNAIDLIFFIPGRSPLSRFLDRDNFIPFIHIFLFFSFGALAQREVLFLKFDNQNIFTL